MAQTIIQIIDQLRQSLNKAQLPDPALRQALSEVLSKHSQEDINETVTTSNDQTLSLLHVAIYVANTPIIDDLIEQGADVNSTDAEKLTPLELALDKQLPRLSKQLIQKAGTKLEVSKLDDLYQYVLNQDSSANMPDLTNKDESKITSALILAIQTNNQLAIDQLCEYTNINSPFDQDGNTLLHLAINEDRADVVKQLLNKGADANAHNKQENPPLFAALTPTKPNDSIVQELMHFGAQAYGLPKELTDKCPESLTQIVEYTSRVINDEIARKMRNLGYSSTVAVVCFGLAEMAKQAHLIDNINNETNTHIKGTAAFNARLELLAKIPDDVFEKHDANTTQILLLPRNQQIEAAFLKLKQEYANTNTTFPLPSDLDNCLIDLQAFFDGISLYQNPNNSPELFDTSSDLSQTASPAKQILMPSILENDPPQEIANFPGVYDLSATESIQQYLQGLHQLLGQTSFTLDITNLGHRIQLSYNHRVNQWCLMDANQLPPKYFNELHILSSDTDELKRFRSLLRQAISKPQTNHGTINTQIFVNQSDALKLANRDLANINQQNNDTDQLQKLHQVYSDQIKAWPMHQLDDTKVSQDPTIMSIACQCGHKDIVEHLVKLPTYQDDKVKLKAPVNSALLNNHPDIVKTLQPHLSGFDEVCLLADSINPHSNYETFKAMLELFDTKPPHNLEIDWEFALLEAAKLGYETYVNDLLQFESNKEHNLVKEDTIPDVIVNALRKNHLNIAETIVQELPNRASSSSIVPWGSLYQAYGLAKQKNCHSVTDYVAAKLKYCPDDLKIAYLSPKDSNNTNKNKTSGSVLNKIKGWLSYHSEQLNSEQIEHNLQPIYQDNTALKYDIYSKLLPFTFEQHNYKLTEALLTCVENDNAISLPFKSLITLAIKKDNSSQFFELIHDKRDSICQSPNSDSYQNDIKQHALVHLAAQDGHLDALKHLIDNYDDNDHSLLNATNEDRLTPLQVAAKNGQTQIVTTLIDHYKQSVNQATQKDQNDLLALAVYSGSQELVDELIHNYGFKVNEEHNNLGQTALHIAAKEGHLELANHLIDNHEAYINAQDNNQDTPLSLAIARQATSSEQDSELVTIIREKMDQYNSTPEDGKTEPESTGEASEKPGKPSFQELSDNSQSFFARNSYMPTRKGLTSIRGSSETFDPNVYVEHIGEQLVAASSQEEPRHDQGYESVTVGYRDNETTASQPKTTLNHHQAKEDASDDNYKSKLNENLNELKASLNKDEVEYLHYKHANPQIGEFTHYLPQQETSSKAAPQQRQHPTSKASKRRVHDFQTQQANAESLRHIINKIINEVGIYTINIDQIDDDFDNPYSIDMGESKDNIELQLTNKQLAYMIIQEHNAQLTGASNPKISVKSRQLEKIEQNFMNKLNQKDIVIDNKDTMPQLLPPNG